MRSILKNCLNVSLLLACTGITSYGKGVDEATAKQIGSNFLRSTYSGLLNSPADLSTTYVAVDQGTFGPIVDYYVFNVNGGHGFIMVSGDDIIEPILAYSNESVFDYNNMAPAAKDWITGYKNEITASINYGATASETTARQWKELGAGSVDNAQRGARKTTSPFPSSTFFLCTSKWDQEPGYNKYCPGFGTAPTGCVATAATQVMYYWKWPIKGCGYHSYTAASFPGNSQTKANFDTAYNWTGMKDNSYTNYTALLMWHFGVAVDMNYTTTSSGSGAYTLIAESPKTNCSEYALKTYFHYKHTIHGVQRYTPTTMSTSAWSALLKTDLDASRPILYSGQGSAGGHAWVCDGYDNTNKFHMNWGWSGTGPNGYYTVDNLNPPALGVGGGGGAFNSYQAVIMGIEPDSFAANSNDNIKLGSQISIGNTVNIPASYILSTATKFTANILNSNSSAFSGDICLQAFDPNLKLMATVATFTGQSIAAGGSLALTFNNTTSLYSLIPGYYKFRVMYRNAGGSTWTPVGDNGVYINEEELTIGNDQSLNLASNISPASGTNVAFGSVLNVSGSVQNNMASGSYSGPIRTVLTNVATGTQTVVGSKNDVIYFSLTNAYSFAMPSVTVTPGTYTLAFQHKDMISGSPTYGQMVYTGSTDYLNPVLINVTGGVGVNTPSVAESKISVFPNPSNGIVNIDLGGIQAHAVTITNIRGQLVDQVDLSNVQGLISVPVSNYAEGMYFVNVFTGNEIVTKKIIVNK